MSYGIIQAFTISNCKVLEKDKFAGYMIDQYLIELIDVIGMKIAPINNPMQIWEDHTYQAEEFKIGTSANVFIETSNISIHACDPQRAIRVCIFTCKNHDYSKAIDYSERFWGGKCVYNKVIEIL